MEKIIFAQALGLQNPKIIEEITFDKEKKRLDIIVKYFEGNLAMCPVCENACKIRDYRTKQLRHLDFFQHQCYISAKVPRVNCPGHGIHLTWFS